MNAIRQDGGVRLVEAIGPYMDVRYEVQERYSYYARMEDEETSTSWRMKCHSHDLGRALEMYERRMAPKGCA